MSMGIHLEVGFATGVEKQEVGVSRTEDESNVSKDTELEINVFA